MLQQMRDLFRYNAWADSRILAAELQAPLWQLLLHVVNHSTYHRGQITSMIRQLGRTPTSTDLVLFHRLGSPAPSG